MARQIHKLNARFVKTVTEKKDYPDGGGLYLQVDGGKSWLYRYKISGKTRYMGLGAYPEVSLADAREAAANWRKVKAEGSDPIVIRDARRREADREQERTITFGECATAYIEAKKAGWSNEKHIEQWTNTLKTYAAPINDLSVQEVDTPRVQACLEPIWSVKPETASRVQLRIKKVLDWARVKNYREGENPARWDGHLSELLPQKNKVKKVTHFAALPFREVAEFMAILRTKDAIAARMLEFTILTGARTGESMGSLWEEIDFEARKWTIPPERMKAGKEHGVPLSDRAIEILRQVEMVRHSDYVFPGQKPGRGLSNMAMTSVLRRMGYGHVTVHGFRSCFRDWAAECTNTPNIVCEMALAHSIRSDVEKAYRRGELFDKRRKLMENWANYCDSTPGEVLAFGGSHAG